VVLVILAAACSAGKVTTTGSPSSPARPVVLRLGYEPDLADAAAVVGVRNGVFPLGLGPSVSFTATSYDSGVDAMGAMRSGALDAAYVDPDPALATFLATNGGVRIIAGAASGGAFLMTKYAIKVPSDLGGQKVAAPGAGSTWDVDLRVWLKS